MSEWISVSESLPQVVYTQLLLLSSGEISTGYLSKRKPKVRWTIHNEEENDVEVTHWMPIPKPPEVNDG